MVVLIKHFISGLGVSYDSDCSKIAPDKNYTFNSTDDIPDIYPCEFGFHYLVVSGAVWIALLPFWICGLFGNCWRQCCCCCCDPVVICSTVVDLLQVLKKLKGWTVKILQVYDCNCKNFCRIKPCFDSIIGYRRGIKKIR